MKINLKEELTKLIEIQGLDLQLVMLKQGSEEEKPSQITALKQECDQKKEKLKALEDRLKAALLKKKDKETRLAAEEDNIRKANTQLYQLKTNKEYKAKLNEIESLKGNKSAFEEEILLVMDEVTAVEKDVEKERQVFQGVEKEFKAREAVLQKEIEEMKEQIRMLADKRKALIVHVDKQIAALYNDLVDHKSGLAIVSVRDNSCGGCFMRVTYQHINEVRMYEDIVRCVSCGRLLYAEEDFVHA